MLGLTDTQGQIIKQFVEHFTNKKGQILNGLTGAELEKYGIVARTFRNHKNYFLDNYLIRLNQFSSMSIFPNFIALRYVSSDLNTIFMS